MLNAGPLATGETHEIRALSPRVRVHLTMMDPRTDTEISLPAGIAVRLLARGSDTPFSAVTDDEGRASLPGTDQLRDVSLFVDFGDDRWLDLDAGERLAKPADNDTRALVLLPEFWRSDEAPSLVDELGGRATGGVIPSLFEEGQGTAAEPWKLRVDHGWPRVETVFEYFDVKAQAVATVPFGAVVEAFRGAPSSKRLVGGATVLTDSGTVTLSLFADCPPKRLRLRLRTAADSCIDLRQADPRQRIVRRSAEQLAALPLLGKPDFYPLPETWLSRGQHCVRGGQSDGAPFEDAVAGAIAAREVIRFDLDDVVLVRSDMRPIAMTRSRRLALFDEHFDVIDPDPQARYFSAVRTTDNLLRARALLRPHQLAGKPPLRAIQRARTFFEVSGARTTKGRVIGARAAVADLHPHKRGPNADLDGTFRARCDVHYFRDTQVHRLGSEEDRTVDVAVIFVSTRLRPVAGQGVDATDLSNARISLAEAAEQWTGGAVPLGWIRSLDKSRDVRLRFHFVELEHGASHINVFMWKRRNFERAHVALAMVIDTDTDIGAGTSVLAHELGHVLGLNDEYIEREGGVPSFVQGARREVLMHDESSMMHGNEAPRLRHYWMMSRWLEKLEGKPALGPYEVFAAPGEHTPRTHHYVRPAQVPSPFSASHGPAELRPGKHGRVEVKLGILGDDLPAVEDLTNLDAVLVVRVKFFVRFTRNDDGDRFTGDEKRKFMRELFEKFRGLDGSGVRKGALCTAELDESEPPSDLAKKHVRRVFLHFLPLFSRSNPAAADFRLVVRKSASTPSANVSSVGRRKLVVTDQFTGEALRAHALGHAARGLPFLEVVGTHITSQINFVRGTSGASQVALRARKERTPGDGTFVGFKDDGVATLLELPPEQIAQNIAEATNDPENEPSELVSAVAIGPRVIFTPKVDGLDLVIQCSSQFAVCGGEWNHTPQPDELRFLADWIGEQVKAKYRVVVAD